MNDECEYCGEPATKIIEGVALCYACYVENIDYLGENQCAGCEEPAELSVSGTPMCRECFDSDPTLTEEDIDE